MKYILTYKLFENKKQFIYNDIVDYTLLDSSATDNDIINLCDDAKKLGVKSVCVLPKHVKIAKNELENSNVLVCTVISFPEGTNTLEQKISETFQVIKDGADEVDMVLNYKLLSDKDEYDYLVDEVKSLVNICNQHDNKNNEHIILKVIVESGLLNDKETENATHICLEAGADFIKTSTGKKNPGFELNKIKIMYDTIKKSGGNMKIKASGGVRTLDDIKSIVPYVDRLGMGSASVDKLNGIKSKETNY